MRLGVLSFCALLAAQIAFVAPQSARSAEIPPDAALKIIRAKEQAISAIRWTCREQWIQQKDVHGIAHFALDANGRFRLSTEAIQRASGDVETVGVREIVTFDGEVIRKQHQQLAGDALPPDKEPAMGLIKTDKSTNVLAQGFATQGMRYFFPYFFPLGDGEQARTLSQYLQSKIDQYGVVHVTEGDDGIWQIVVLDTVTPAQDTASDLRMFAHIRFSPGKGRAGAVLEVLTSRLEDPRAAAEQAGESLEKISYELQEIDGFWVPQTVTFFHRTKDLTYDPVVQYTFSDVAVNRPLTEADFIIEWKKGTNMVDEVAGQLYTVSGDPVDEKKAVEAFAVFHGLKVPEQIVAHRRRFILPAVVAVLLLVVILKWGRRFVQHFKGGAAAVMVLGTFLGGVANQSRAGVAEPASANPRFQFDNGWWRDHDGRFEARITQCSFYATGLTMTILGVPYNPVLVSENLVPSVEGVPLNSLQRVLTAYGLVAEGRRDVSIRDLRRIRSGMVAIFALPISGGDHYYVLSRNQKGVYLADVPRGVTYLDDVSADEIAKIDGALAARHGIVLFAYRGVASRSSETVEIRPASIDLGEFGVGGEASSSKSVESTISLQNNSDVPVAVEMYSSCGCLGRLSWQRKIIDANSAEPLTISTSRGDWPQGRRVQYLLAQFSDGRSKRISIFGTRHDGHGSPSMHVSSARETEMRITDRDVDAPQYKTDLGLFVAQELRDGLEVESSMKAVEASIQEVSEESAASSPTSGESHRVVCVLERSKELTENLLSHDNELHALITVRANEVRREAQFRLAITREARIEFSPAEATLNGDARAKVEVITREWFKEAIKEIAVTAQPDGLECGVVRGPEGRYFVELLRSADSAHRHFVVTCHVTFADGDRDARHFTVSSPVN
ncbi:MAG TPA: hypothetical protein VGG64_19825 [Pirellulales bacterium]|jgi:hypothetical protein